MPTSFFTHGKKGSEIHEEMELSKTKRAIMRGAKLHTWQFTNMTPDGRPRFKCLYCDHVDFAAKWPNTPNPDPMSPCFGEYRKLKVLIACEFSGIVREAFAYRGQDAYSCDLLPSEKTDDNHFQDNVLEILHYGFDLMIAFPPCTHLCRSGAQWTKDEPKLRDQALDFVKALMSAPIEMIAIENPIGIISTKIRKPDQIIQPWQFGHNETKATCLWLQNLPKLKPTNIVAGRDHKVHMHGETKNRWKDRSRTLQGIAVAMAEQWA